MAGTILTVAQQKGGAGKTTLVAHLAVAIAGAGRRVATVDIDPQASLTRWIEARSGGDRDGSSGPGLTHRRIGGWRTAAEVDRLARDHDVVLVDSPPHMETEARIAVRAATLVIVPVQPSPMDLWASRPTVEMAVQEKRPVLIVLNRVPPRATLADEIIARVDELGAPVAAARIGNRVAFASALMAGRSVTETSRSSRAAREIGALAEEVLARAR